jgi:hypothetical protein
MLIWRSWKVTYDRKRSASGNSRAADVVAEVLLLNVERLAEFGKCKWLVLGSRRDHHSSYFERWSIYCATGIGRPSRKTKELAKEAYPAKRAKSTCADRLEPRDLSRNESSKTPDSTRPVRLRVLYLLEVRICMAFCKMFQVGRVKQYSTEGKRTIVRDHSHLSTSPPVRKLYTTTTLTA